MNEVFVDVLLSERIHFFCVFRIAFHVNQPVFWRCNHGVNYISREGRQRCGLVKQIFRRDDLLFGAIHVHAVLVLDTNFQFGEGQSKIVFDGFDRAK